LVLESTWYALQAQYLVPFVDQSLVESTAKHQHDPETVDRAAEHSETNHDPDAVDRAAEQSVIAESGVLEQRVGHDGFPVEELNFVGGSVAAGRHQVRKEGGDEQGGDI